MRVGTDVHLAAARVRRNSGLHASARSACAGNSFPMRIA
jgi:hypothetical protein